MRTVASPISLVTGAIRSSNSSPSESSMSLDAPTSTTPAVSVGKFSVRMGKLSLSGQVAPVLREVGNFVGDELCVFLDPPEQRGAPRVLPGESEEIEAGHVGDPATVAQCAGFIGNREINPRVVEAVARRPDDRINVDRAP